VDQEENARGFRGTAGIAQALAKSLRVELMRPISRMAKSLFAEDPDLRHALQMPSARSYEKTIAAALALAARVDEHKARFVAAGFAEDFVDRLRKGATDLRVALDAKSVHYGKRSAASAGMVDELARGRELIRMLDDMVSATLRATPNRLAEWRTLSRFARRGKEEKVVVPPDGTPNVPPSGTPAPPPVTPTPPVAAAVHEPAGLDRAA